MGEALGITGKFTGLCQITPFSPGIDTYNRVQEVSNLRQCKTNSKNISVSNLLAGAQFVQCQ